MLHSRHCIDHACALTLYTWSGDTPTQTSAYLLPTVCLPARLSALPPACLLVCPPCRTLHEEDKPRPGELSRFSLFLFFACAMFIWYWIPGYFIPYVSHVVGQGLE